MFNIIFDDKSYPYDAAELMRRSGIPRRPNENGDGTPKISEVRMLDKKLIDYFRYTNNETEKDALFFHLGGILCDWADAHMDAKEILSVEVKTNIDDEMSYSEDMDIQYRAIMVYK